jgi:hypothetical protein
MRVLTNNELHRLRHIVAEQANTAQSTGDGYYLHLPRFDAQDVADALEELVALRAQEEDAARRDKEKQAVVETRLDTVDESVDELEESLRNLSGAVSMLRLAVEGR